MNLLLLSSSRVDQTNYLEHAETYIKQHLTDINEILFIPYAGISISFDDYETLVANAFKQFGYKVRSIHQFDDPKQAIADAQAIAVGGGNTFCLLKSLQELDLIQNIKDRVTQGMPYIGWSAGSNIIAPTIRTTNDMPIVEPNSFDALALLPFQINPHYIDGNPPGHNGETREMRINEFLVMNPKQYVVGIPEGTALKIEANRVSFIGNKSGYLFSVEHGKQRLSSDSDLSHLL